MGGRVCRRRQEVQPGQDLQVTSWPSSSVCLLSFESAEYHKPNEASGQRAMRLDTPSAQSEFLEAGWQVRERRLLSHQWTQHSPAKPIMSLGRCLTCSHTTNLDFHQRTDMACPQGFHVERSRVWTNFDHNKVQYLAQNLDRQLEAAGWTRKICKSLHWTKLLAGKQRSKCTRIARCG